MQLYITTLDFEDPLQRDMFRDRARVFHEKLKWPDVKVDERGFEIDEYDIEDEATYLILHEDGKHIASLRSMNVMAGCMAVEKFDGLCTLDMIDEPETCEEITRFCVMDGADRRAASALMWLNSKRIYESPISKSCLGVFHKPMRRVYKSIGFEPRVINKIDRLYVGQWDEDEYERLMAANKIPQEYL